jgi:hypothetical protein
MQRLLSSLLCAGLLMLVTLAVGAQQIPNKKLSQSDLEAAQSELKSAGGKDAVLIYTTRLDAVQRGAFDSLVVIYSKGNDHYAMVVRGGKRYMLKAAQKEQAIQPGNRFLRLGIKYEEGKAPLLRLFATDSSGAMRNMDYRYNGLDFVPEGQ